MFIAKNNDLIILANNSKEELEQQLQFMVYTDIEETDINYQLYNGSYLTPEEIEAKEQERISNLTMTALDLISYIQKEGVALADINTFLENNLELKMQLTYCQNVYCGVLLNIAPITIGDLEITKEKVIEWFKDKNGEN